MQIVITLYMPIFFVNKKFWCWDKPNKAIINFGIWFFYVTVLKAEFGLSFFITLSLFWHSSKRNYFYKRMRYFMCDFKPFKIYLFSFTFFSCFQCTEIPRFKSSMPTQRQLTWSQRPRHQTTSRMEPANIEDWALKTQVNIIC